MIELAARAGKHVLADQTQAMTLREADRVASHIRQANIRFAIDMSLKRWPINLAAANAARSGALGEVTGMRVRNAHHSAVAAGASFASRFLEAPMAYSPISAPMACTWRIAFWGVPTPSPPL